MSSPRSDAKLKNLSEDRQEQIYDWATSPKTDTCVGGLAFARQQLALDGEQVSLRALSEFRRWFKLRLDFREAQLVSETATELMREFAPGDEEKAVAFGQMVFTRRAIAQEDAQTFVGLERLALDKRSAADKGRIETEKLRLQRIRVETEACDFYLRMRKDARAAEIADSSMSNGDKIKALRSEYFKDVDAMEAAGTVQLPE